MATRPKKERTCLDPENHNTPTTNVILREANANCRLTTREPFAPRQVPRHGGAALWPVAEASPVLFLATPLYRCLHSAASSMLTREGGWLVENAIGFKRGGGGGQPEKSYEIVRLVAKRSFLRGSILRIYREKINARGCR